MCNVSSFVCAAAKGRTIPTDDRDAWTVPLVGSINVRVRYRSNPHSRTDRYHFSMKHIIQIHKSRKRLLLLPKKLPVLQLLLLVVAGSRRSSLKYGGEFTG